MDAELAWSLLIAGFTDTAFARRAARRFRAGPLEAVRFAEGEVTGAPFAEFFAYGCDPAEALAAVAASRPPQRHYLTVLEDRPGLQETIERGGFRLDDTEALMALDLAAAPLPAPAWQGAVDAVGQADHRVDVRDRPLVLEVRLPGAEGVAAQGELHRAPARRVEGVKGGSQIKPDFWLHRCLAEGTASMAATPSPRCSATV